MLGRSPRMRGAEAAAGEPRARSRPRPPVSGFLAAPNDGTLHAVVLLLIVARGWTGQERPVKPWTNVWCLRIGLLEVEVARRLLLEPEPVVLGRLLEEFGRVLEQVLASLALVLVDSSRSAPPRARTECPRSSRSRCRASVWASARPPRAAVRDLFDGLLVRLLTGSSATCSLGSASGSAATSVAPPPSSGSAARGKSRRAGPSASASSWRDLLVARAVAALEVEVLPDRVVENPHRARSLASFRLDFRSRPARAPPAPPGSCRRAWLCRAPRRPRRSAIPSIARRLRQRGHPEARRDAAARRGRPGA